MEETVKCRQFDSGVAEFSINLLVAKEELISGKPIKVILNLASDEYKGKGMSLRSFAEQFCQYAECYNRRDRRMTLACAKHLETFAQLESEDLLTPAAMERFYNYLVERLNGATPANYFKKVRQFFEKKVKGGEIERNFAADVVLHSFCYREKVALKDVDILQLIKTPCHNEEVKRAFLFSCFTGLRWCDIKRLRTENIDMEMHTLSIDQQKVAGHSKKAHLHTPLNRNALDILGDMTHSGLVFHLPTYNNMRTTLCKWVGDAGLEDNITFHCARHTFISSLVAKGVDLKTVADLAGHSSTRHTERYAHAHEEHLIESLRKIEITGE